MKTYNVRDKNYVMMFRIAMFSNKEIMPSTFTKLNLNYKDCILYWYE